MKRRTLTAMFVMVSCLASGQIYATEHHSGHNMAGGGGSENACVKPVLNRFAPAPMTTVAPGSAFSFYASQVEKANQIKVTVKSIPVDLVIEDKESFFLVHGKLPTELVNTIARINIKVNAKFSKCSGENGWLVKIAEQ